MSTFAAGMATSSTAAADRKTSQARGERRRGPFISALRRAALEREEAARAPLNEEDDRHEHDDFAEHRARHRLQELVDDAEAHRARERAQERAHAAEHHHHEAVDDEDGAEIRA